MDANELLMGRAKVRSAKFPDFEYRTVVGTIVRPPEPMQQREYKKDGSMGKPLFWEDGTPKMQVVVHLQTSEREDADDDGIRAIYLRWKDKAAVRDAVIKAGAEGLEVGGTLALKHVSGNGNDPKEWAAEYKPPVSAGNASLMNDGAPTTNGHAAAQPAAPVSGLGSLLAGAQPVAPTTTATAPDVPPAGAPEGIKATWNTLDAATKALLRQQFPGF